MATMTTYEQLVEQIAQAIIPEGQFIRLYVNDMEVHIGKTEDKIWINITGIHAQLNGRVKNPQDSATHWFSTTIMKKEYAKENIEFLEGKEFIDKDGVKDIGFYIEFNLRFVGLIYKTIIWIPADMWFNGLKDWDIQSGKGWIYVIQLPSKRGTKQFKYGKTICPIARWRVYMRTEDETLRKFGILILCLVFVDNTSNYEDELGKKVFCPKNKCEIVEGDEYFEIKDPKLEPGLDSFNRISELLDPFLDKVNKGLAYTDEAFDDNCYDEDSEYLTYRFRLKQDM